MKTRISPEWLWRVLCTLIALIVLALVGYDTYVQFRTPGLDFSFDHSGLVREVPFETYADWAGLHPGDVIQTVDGTPFRKWMKGDWHDLSQGPYMMQISRNGRLHTIEIPAIPLARMNVLSLTSAALVALTFWGIGIILLLRRFQRQDVRILFLLSEVFAVLLLFPLAHPAPYLAPRWGLVLSSACMYVAAPLLLHYYLTFPVPLGTPAQRRWWLGAIYGFDLIALALWWINSPWRRWGATYAVLLIVAAVVVLVYVYARRASPAGRRHLRVVVLGNVVAMFPGISFYILPQLFNINPYIPEWLVALSLVVAPLSYLYATLRHNLFDIDRLLNRTLVYTLLSVGILLLYLGPFLLLYRFARGDPLAHAMTASGLTLLVGLAFDWSRTQVQRLVDRVFYGGWYDYPGVVETISDALACTIERQQLIHVLTRQVPEMMHLHPAQLQITQSPHQPILPSTNAQTTQFPFTFQDQVRALWTLGPRRDGDDLTAADRRILQTLARQAEVALGNVLLVEMLRCQLDEIRATQRQLLRSREEERGRLARDLHDGPIQVLVGLNLQLGLLLSNPHHPATELKAMRAEIRQLLNELRQVCGELRPPMLDTLGLSAAVRTLAEQWSVDQHATQHSHQTPTTVHLDLPADAELPPVSEEVAVNLYRVVQEALGNVARHAQAQHVTIRLTTDDDSLILTIQDDGQGFTIPPTFQDLTAHGHFGLIGMQERVDLIGGTLTLDSTPEEGTIVRIQCQTSPSD